MLVPSNSRFALKRPHDPPGEGPRYLQFAGIFILVLAVTPRLAVATDITKTQSTDEILLLEVQVNGHSTGKIGEFTLRHGKLMARPEELHDLGLRVPDSGASGPGGLIALSDLSGLTCSIDQKNSELYITAGDGRLVPTLLQAGIREEPDSRRVIESGTGMTLNYDIVSTYADEQPGA